MFSTNFKEIDPCVPNYFIERIVNSGFLVKHPEKPRHVKAAPKLNRMFEERNVRVSQRYSVATS